MTVPHTPADGAVPLVRRFAVGHGVMTDGHGTTRFVGVDLTLDDGRRTAFALTTDELPLLVEHLLDRYEQALAPTPTGDPA